MRSLVRKWKLLITGFLSFAFLYTMTAEASESTKFCAAVRGNGAKIFVHTSSLARIHELYGMLWGISGGSSGSIVSFLVDSIYANPLVHQCGEKACSEMEKSARAALLLKSFQDYPDALSEFPESSIFFLPGKITQELKSKKIDQMFVDSPDSAFKTLNEILSSPEYSSLINQEIIKTLRETSEPVAMAKDIVAGIYGASDWKFDSLAIFFRPGAISFQVFANYFGRLGSFYALEGEYADFSGMSEFLNNCSVQGIGRSWSDVSHLQSGSMTCSNHFKALLTDYYQKSRHDRQQAPSRADTGVGQSLHVLATVTQVENETAIEWRQARKEYVQNVNFSWQPNFNDWSIAYIGESKDLDFLLLNKKNFVDLKTSRVRVIKNMKWRDVLEHAPAEPSISRALEIEGGTVTTGGWMDSQPVQALMNISCDKVLVLDTRFKEIKFQEDVAALLGADQSQLDKLFSLNDPTSSVSIAVKNAAGIWCTNWNEINVTDMNRLTDLGWNGLLETDDSFLLKPRYAYNNVQNKQRSSQCF